MPEADTPAAAVAGLFGRLGTSAVDLLRGSFAGVATDGQVVFAFRDHVGGRPLFYRNEHDQGWVATEPKQVLAGSEIARAPNLEAIQLMFFRGIGPDAAVKGVQRIFYSEVIRLTPGERPKSQRYWNPSDKLETLKITHTGAIERLRHELETAVTRAVSGFDAVALSGGIDSPTVAAFAAPAHLKRSGRPLHAYSAIYPHHPSADEWGYTSLVAKHLGIEVTPFEPQSTLLDNIEYWVDLVDGPWDSVPMSVAHQGYSLAASMGAQQVLTGTLAEYVFTINRFILGHLLLRGRFRALGRQMSVRRSSGNSAVRLVRQLLVESTPAPVAKAHALAKRRRSSFVPHWIDTTATGAPRYVTPLADPARRRWVNPTLAATRGTTSTQEAMEICASAAGVHVRYPLADRDLWEFFLSLPAEVKFPDLTPKSIVREAMRGILPHEILDRKDKTAFDEYVLDSVPWDVVARLVDDRDYRMPGVDYSMLLDRLARRDMSPTEVVWAHDLAVVHAFVNLFK